MRPLILGHRGYSSKYIENTRESFRQALLAGADGLELDIHMTRDGQLVVFHDFELKRMTGQEGYIFQYSLEELNNFKIKGEHDFLTLNQVVEDLVTYQKDLGRKLYLNVEFKAGSSMYEGIEARAMAVCFERLPVDQVIFSSFDHHALLAIKTLDHTALTGVLTTCAMVEPWDYLSKLGADYYHPHYLTLSPLTLPPLLQAGVQINTYTLNDPQIARQLMVSGLHMIITDAVGTMVDLRREVLGEA